MLESFAALGKRAVPSGSTLPTSGVSAGDLYLHTPTGRSILHQYDGSNWLPLHGYGAMAVYVDGSSGTDAVDKGYGTGSNAFATIQYAVNRMAPIFDGNVTINVAAGTYREIVTILGFYAKGDVRLIIKGTLSVTTSGTATSGAAQTLTDSGQAWTVNAYRGLKVKITGGTGSGQEKLVQSNTATALTIVGKWNTNPDATSTYEVYTRDTRVTGSDAGADTTAVRSNVFWVQSSGVELHDMLCNYALVVAVLLDYGAANLVRLKNVEAANSSTGVQARMSVTAVARLVYAHDNSNVGINITQNATLAPANVYCRANTNNGMSVQFGGIMPYQNAPSDGDLSGGLLFDANGAAGLSVATGGQTGGAPNTSMFAESTNNGTWGVLAATGGHANGVQAWTYSGNVSGTYSPTTAIAGSTN